MGVNEHFEAIYNAVSCQLKGFKTASKVIVTTLPKFLTITEESQALNRDGQRRLYAASNKAPQGWHKKHVFLWKGHG